MRLRCKQRARREKGKGGRGKLKGINKAAFEDAALFIYGIE